MFDLFNGTTYQNNFHWIVGVFRNGGATEVIKRANDIPLRTYYPFKFNGNGEPIPLWTNYLFVEFRGMVTVNICKSTYRFIKIISHHDEDGILHPVLVPKNAIDENLALVQQGKFNERVFIRKFHGRGSLIRVIEGTFIDKRVRLEMDIPPNMPGDKKVMVSIGNWSGRIELFKLAL